MPHMKLYDGVIFDLDGTLWNAAGATTNSWNSVIQKFGIPSVSLVKADIERVTGQPFKECVETLFSKSTQNDYPRLMEWLSESEREFVTTDGGDFYDGLLEGIPKISKNHSLFIVSNCQDWYLECFFKHSRLGSYFKDVDCYGSSNSPKSEMIRNMANGHNLTSPIYIGDTSSDREASDLADVDFGYAEYGFGNLSGERISFPDFKKIVDFFCSGD